AIQIPKTISEEELSSLKTSEKFDDSLKTEEYTTPDLNAYPPDYQSEDYIVPSDTNNNLFYAEQASTDLSESYDAKSLDEPFFDETKQLNLELSTELGLIQQEYAYDQKGSNDAEINVYITITLTKTFIISIDFTHYPERPVITFPDEVKKILRDPYRTLNTLREWSSKKPPHIVDLLHELEKNLFFIKEIEIQSKRISGEYQSKKIPNSLTALKVHLMTYGFKEYTMVIDLESYPNPPVIDLSPELQQIIQISTTELDAYKNWKENESEPVEIVREISWLVDKNSRINFEIDLLKDHYKNIKYEPSTAILHVEMKGKMKTEDLTFEFQINLPIDYPMKMPEVKVVNEFEI
ncbi:unnamed protein product, partial [marine sediment metagenome]